MCAREHSYFRKHNEASMWISNSGHEPFTRSDFDADLSNAPKWPCIPSLYASADPHCPGMHVTYVQQEFRILNQHCWLIALWLAGRVGAWKRHVNKYAIFEPIVPLKASFDMAYVYEIDMLQHIDLFWKENLWSRLTKTYAYPLYNHEKDADQIWSTSGSASALQPWLSVDWGPAPQWSG